jgi:hypothetical protein
MVGIRVGGGHLNTDLSVSPALITFLASEETSSSTVLPSLFLILLASVTPAEEWS